MTAASDIVITGIGLVLPGCDDKATFWKQISSGDSQVTLGPDPVAEHLVMPAGRITGFDAPRSLAEIPEEFRTRYSYETKLYMASFLRARRDAGLVGADLDLHRVGLFGGCSRPTMPYLWDRIADGADFGRRDLMALTPTNALGFAASYLGVQGPTFMMVAACASSAAAADVAMMKLEAGGLDVAFVSGFELPLLKPLIAIYRNAGLLSEQRTNPRTALRAYVNHSGNVFGEAALTLVFETRAHAEKRGATPLARVVSTAYGNDGVHPLRVDPEGRRIQSLMREGLGRTGLATDDVDVVVGHGNGNEVSDLSEEAYMRGVFGERREAVPLVSIKPIHGHSLGCSGVVNIAAATMMIANDFVAPTINIDAAAARPGANYQANVGAARRVERAFCVTYGLGGHSAVTLLAKP